MPATSPACPRPTPSASASGCHSDIADLRKKPVHHQPAFGQGCATCHTPHGGDNDHLLRAKGNALCLECHGPDSVPQKDRSGHLLTIFNGQVKLPDDYYQKNKVPILPLQFGLGHPVEYHPVSDVMDPTNQSKVKTSSAVSPAISRTLRRSPICWSRTRPTTWRSATPATRTGSI